MQNRRFKIQRFVLLVFKIYAPESFSDTPQNLFDNILGKSSFYLFELISNWLRWMFFLRHFAQILPLPPPRHAFRGLLQTAVSPLSQPETQAGRQASSREYALVLLTSP